MALPKGFSKASQRRETFEQALGSHVEVCPVGPGRYLRKGLSTQGCTIMSRPVGLVISLIECGQCIG